MFGSAIVDRLIDIYVTPAVSLRSSNLANSRRRAFRAPDRWEPTNPLRGRLSVGHSSMASRRFCLFWRMKALPANLLKW